MKKRKHILILLTLIIISITLSACSSNKVKNPYAKDEKDAPIGKFNDSGDDNREDFDLTEISNPFIKKFASVLNSKDIIVTNIDEFDVEPIDTVYGEIEYYSLNIKEMGDIYVYRFERGSSEHIKAGTIDALDPISKGSRYNAVVNSEYALVIDDVDEEIIEAFKAVK